MKYARKCSITGEGMNEGFVYMDGEEYFKHEKDLLDRLKNDNSDNRSDVSDEFLLQESYECELYYYTEWEDEDDYQYEMIDGELVEIQ